MQNMIADRQRLAKWRDDLERRQRTQMYLDFYHNRVQRHLLPILQQMVDSEEARELARYLEHDNITERMIHAISLVFAEPLRVRVRRREQSGWGDDAALQSRLDRLLAASRLGLALKEVERLSKLTFDVAVLPQLRHGAIELDIITGEKAFVEQAEDNPTHAARFYYQVGVRQNTPQPGRVDNYHAWCEEGKFACVVDADGQPGNFVRLPHIDYGGRLPVVMFRNYLPVDSFWRDAENAVVQKNIAIDLRRTDLAMAEAYNIPQLLTIGAPEDQEMKKGRTFKLDIPRNELGDTVGDARYLKPSESLREQNELIRDRIEQLGLSLGLSRSVITGQTASSGYELALAKHEILERNRSDREYYRASVTELVKVMMDTARLGLGADFPADAEITVDFGEIRFAQSDLDKLRARKHKLEMGLASRLDFILEDNPDLDREAGKAQLERIEAEEMKKTGNVNE
ncbi:MAG: hypothetical protein K8R90_03700 [Candidatus Cloacimonetes bacterium]|nr:hypothetical protein [Candidatus Cloacimonadota bacterium]